MHKFYRGKKFGLHFVIIKQLPVVSNRPSGKNSPNLVTLEGRVARWYFSNQKSQLV
jgi:hypothetical protein